MDEAAELSPSSIASLLRLRTRQLALLVLLDTERNLGRAAQALHVSQPAASKLLAQTESAFAAPLFERQPRGMLPTAQGEVVIRYARRMLNGFGRVQEELAAVRDGLYGSVRIGSVPGAVPALLAPALAEFKRSHPGVAVSVEVGTSNFMAGRLARGEVDLVLGRPAAQAPQVLPAEVLLDEDLVVVARAGHPLAGRRALSFAHLASAAWILQPAGSPQRVRFDAVLAQHGAMQRLDVTETASTVVATALLEQSDMVAVMPASLAAHYGRLGGIIVLDTDFPMRVAPIHLLEGEGLSPAAARFAGLLRTRAARQATRVPPEDD